MRKYPLHNQNSRKDNMTLRKILTVCSNAKERAKARESSLIEAVLKSPDRAWRKFAERNVLEEKELCAYSDLATALLLTLPDSILDRKLDKRKKEHFAEILANISFSTE